jgi:hypothetical protein
MAQWSLYVCYRGNSGRHLLAASISHFDPKRSYPWSHQFAVDVAQVFTVSIGCVAFGATTQLA